MISTLFPSGRNAKRYSTGFGLIATALLLSGCGSSFDSQANRPDLSPKMVEKGQSVPKGGGYHKIGKPYQINNKWYRPRANRRYDRVGTASWYGDLFHGRKTANGEVFDMDALTAAHPTLPLPTLVEVTNLSNRRSIIVRVNDRGPYRHNRLIDLSRKAAQALDFQQKGTAKVRVRYIGPAPLDGDDGLEQRTLASRVWAREYAGAPPARRPRYDTRYGARTIGARRADKASRKRFEARFAFPLGD